MFCNKAKTYVLATLLYHMEARLLCDVISRSSNKLIVTFSEIHILLKKYVYTVQLEFNFTLACGEFPYITLHCTCNSAIFIEYVEFTQIFGVHLCALQYLPHWYT